MYRSLTTRTRRGLAALGVGGAALALGVASSAVAAPVASAAVSGQSCDLYAAGGTPCVAAHSTTRALYAAYDGPLYQVTRASDGTSTDIHPVAAGSYADSAAQDAFCAGTTCEISTIYDQSPQHNDLTRAPAGGFSGPGPDGSDALADATAAPVMLNGHRVYGVDITPGTGYRDNQTTGIATGDDPEGMYAVLDGTHYNGGCCMDYGNAETDSHDDGNGTMEAIYFGNNTVWGSGPGSGPWIMADLENGLFSGVHTRYNAGDLSIKSRFVTAMVKGGHDVWAIRGADSQKSGVSTYYSGARPNEVSGYDPMQKQGAIILGIGGDNSVGAAGTFYEGVMTSGYPSDLTENKVAASVKAAAYTAYPVPLQPGPQVSLALAASPSTYVQHDLADDEVHAVTLSKQSPGADRKRATFVETAGLADPACVSFEATDAPGTFLRHYAFVLHAQPNDGTAIFASDATFCPKPGNSGTGTSFQSKNYPDRYLRDYQGQVYIASNGGNLAWDDPTGWASDTTWTVAPPLRKAS